MLKNFFFIILSVGFLIVTTNIFPSNISAEEATYCYYYGEGSNPENHPMCVTSEVQNICYEKDPKFLDEWRTNPYRGCMVDPSKIKYYCNASPDHTPTQNCDTVPPFLIYYCGDDLIENEGCRIYIPRQDLYLLGYYIQHPDKFKYQDYGELTIKTPFGTMDPKSLTSVAGQFVTFAIGLAATGALLLLAIGGYGIMTSAGSPDKLNASKETITSALMGIAFIALSVAIIRIIGRILQIPGF